MISWPSLLLGLVVWAVLTGGALDSWLIGVPVTVAIAVVVTRWRPQSAHRVQWGAVPGFLWFFLRRSLVAGVDVARRTLMPVIPLSPAVVTYRTQLGAGAPRVLFAGTLSLLPGSLCVSIDDDCLAVHVLDAEHDVVGDLGEVERRVAAIFQRTLT
jgi:multicomponent Na+:H+ antiporter subunit E